MTERWWKPFKDNRNWVRYNEELVVRGEFLLELEWVKSWDNELNGMNDGKRGAPFIFPESLIKLQGLWHQWVDYRGIEGITRKVAEYGIVPAFNDYSTISRRVNGLGISFNLPREGHVTVTSDGSGMKMTNSGEYRQNKYGDKRKKYLRVTITADPCRKDLLACDVCIDGEGSSEPRTAQNHMETIIGRGVFVEKFFGDGSFDTRRIFNFCEKNGIETAVKIRKNATAKSRGSMRRSREVKDYTSEGYRKWAKENEYGQRWAVEGIFSSVKRKFGENTKSRRICNMMHEAGMKFWAYQRMKDYAKARIGA